VADASSRQSAFLRSRCRGTRRVGIRCPGQGLRSRTKRGPAADCPRESTTAEVTGTADAPINAQAIGSAWRGSRPQSADGTEGSLDPRDRSRRMPFGASAFPAQEWTFAGGTDRRHPTPHNVVPRGRMSSPIPRSIALEFGPDCRQRPIQPRHRHVRRERPADRRRPGFARHRRGRSRLISALLLCRGAGGGRHRAPPRFCVRST
jgi:hypothetical protein